MIRLFCAVLLSLSFTTPLFGMQTTSKCPLVLVENPLRSARPYDIEVSPEQLPNLSIRARESRLGSLAAHPYWVEIKVSGKPIATYGPKVYVQSFWGKRNDVTHHYYPFPGFASEPGLFSGGMVRGLTEVWKATVNRAAISNLSVVIRLHSEIWKEREVNDRIAAIVGAIREMQSRTDGSDVSD